MCRKRFFFSSFVTIFISFTGGGDVAAETHEKLISLAHRDLRRGPHEVVVAPSSQPAQLPAEVPAGDGDQQDGAGLVPPPLEDDGDGVAADRLLQLLRQGGEMTELRRGEETEHEQSDGGRRRTT